MNITEALEKLDQWQSQILKPSTMGEVADAVREFIKDVDELKRDFHDCLEWIEQGNDNQDGMMLIVGPLRAKYFEG